MSNNYITPEFLKKKYDFNKSTISLLLSKKFTDEINLQNYLFPSADNFSDPFVLNGMKEAIQLINKHIINKSKFLIYGDYDCDGICASAILYISLQEAGCDVNVFLPNREIDGYGLTLDSVKKILNDYKPDIIITVDCGIRSIEEVNIIKASGVDIIITDHHEPGKNIPECIVIDPKIQKDITELSGAGVAFKLIHSLFGLDSALNHIDLCAIATVCDLVPLNLDNRIIVSLGLAKINSNKCGIGLKEIINSSMLFNGRKNQIKSSDIAFRIGPRINASGRITSAYKSFKLLTSNNGDEARELATQLDNENKIRQKLCLTTIESAKEMLLEYDLANLSIIVLYNNTWEAGIVGIAASKIAEEFYRPTILLTSLDDNLLKGSCRSINGINIFDVLKNNSKYLNHYGGHEMAAGLAINKEFINIFIESCDSYIKNRYNSDVFKISFDYDLDIGDLSEITVKLAKELTQLEPFGMGNKKPVFKINVKKMSFMRIGKHPHIKQEFNNDIDLIGFNLANSMEILNSNATKNLFITIGLDEFKSRQYANCIIKDFNIMDYEFDENILIFNKMARYLPNKSIKKLNNNSFCPSKNFGTIVLVWDFKSFIEAKKLFPNFLIEFNNLNSLNPYNTILFSPMPEIFLGYFSKIILCDSTPEIYFKNIVDMYSAQIELVHFAKESTVNRFITRDDLNLLYVYIRKYTTPNDDISDIDNLYVILKQKGLNMQVHVFKICAIIFLELGIIYIDYDNSLTLNSISTNLQDSNIFNIVGIC